MDYILDFLRNFGSMGLFIHALIDAVIFPIPAFFLQVSLSVLDPSNALWLATLGYIGCMVGTPIGYGLGKASGNLILNRILKRKWLDSATNLFKKHGEAAILLGSFTPIPFKIFTILSGVMNYPLWKLMGYAALGRAVKFYAVGILFYMYGRSAEHMLDRVLTIITVVAIVLVLGIWLLIRWIRKKRKLVALQEADVQNEADSLSSSDSVILTQSTIHADINPAIEEAITNLEAMDSKQRHPNPKQNSKQGGVHTGSNGQL